MKSLSLLDKILLSTMLVILVLVGISLIFDYAMDKAYDQGSKECQEKFSNWLNESISGNGELTIVYGDGSGVVYKIDRIIQANQ